MWALSLNGGRAAAHGTRRLGCARGLGLRGHPYSCQCGGVQAKGLRYLGMAGVGAFTIPYVNDNVGIVS